jgi:sortase A
MPESRQGHPAREAPGGQLVSRLRALDLAAWLDSSMKMVGVTLLVSCAISFLDSWAYQGSESFALGIERLRGGDRTAGSTEPKIYFEGQSLGWIEVPRLGILAVVAHGDDSRTLGRAVGHIPGTALPGRGGNVGLAAHRDTFFRALEDVRAGAAIRLVMPEKTYDYHVVEVSVVRPDRVDVLDPTRLSTLTLVTCYPFEYIGSAPYRYIIRAMEGPP